MAELCLQEAEGHWLEGLWTRIGHQQPLLW